jgi:hypothetical protein
VTAAVPNEPMAARVEPPCCWWSGLPRNAGRHIHRRSQLVAPPTSIRSRVSARPSPTIPIPSMRCGTSSAVFTGTKLARFLADDEPIQEQHEVDRATKHQVMAGLRCGARHSQAGDSEQQVHDAVQDRHHVVGLWLLAAPGQHLQHARLNSNRALLFTGVGADAHDGAGYRGHRPLQ